MKTFSLIFQVEAQTEIKQLKQRCVVLESRLDPSVAHVDEMTVEPFNDLNLDLDELIFLVGGYDGASWLSALDSYSPSHDVIKSLKPMNCIRSYSSIARLNGELYVFGGGNGSLWYDSGSSLASVVCVVNYLYLLTFPYLFL